MVSRPFALVLLFLFAVVCAGCSAPVSESSSGDGATASESSTAGADDSTSTDYHDIADEWVLVDRPVSTDSLSVNC